MFGQHRQPEDHGGQIDEIAKDEAKPHEEGRPETEPSARATIAVIPGPGWPPR